MENYTRKSYLQLRDSFIIYTKLSCEKVTKRLKLYF